MVEDFYIKIMVWLFWRRNLCYCIPKSLKYEGKEIENALEILSDFKEDEKRTMEIDEIYKEEELNEAFEDGINQKTLEIVD